MKWKTIPSLPLYEASKDGQVRAKRRIVNFGLQKRAIGGLPLSSKTKKNGYKELSLTLDVNTRRSFYVHRLIAETWIGKIPPKMTVNHKDFNKSNNAVSNLEIISQKENNRHARLLKKFKPGGTKGSLHKLAVTNEGEVLKIREDHKKHRSIKKLMSDYPHLTKPILTKIVYWQSWKHVKNF